MTRYALAALALASFAYCMGVDPLLVLGGLALVAGLATCVAIALAFRGAA